VIKKSSAAKVVVFECAEPFFDLNVLDRILTVELLRYKERDCFHGKPNGIMR